MIWLSFSHVKQFAWTRAESAGYAFKIHERNISFSALDGTHVSAVKTAPRCEAFLGETRVRAQSPNNEAEPPLENAHGGTLLDGLLESTPYK